MFRLELLENIFSLLFLSTSDFVQQVQKDSNTDTDAHSECTSDATDQNVEAVDPDETEQKRREEQKQCPRSAAAHGGHLDLEHLIQGCRGFLVDVTAMKGFLKLLKEGLEGMCVVGRQEGQETGRALPREAEAAAVLGCSVTAETFGARLQRLSKHTAEAQWRLQIITSNQGTGELQRLQLVLIDHSVKNPQTFTEVVHFNQNQTTLFFIKRHKSFRKIQWV